MEEEMIQPGALVLVLFGGIVSLGCGGSEPPPNDASSVNSPGNTGPDITTGPGAGETSDTSPDSSATATEPDSTDDRSTGSAGPGTGSSSVTPSASPVH